MIKVNIIKDGVVTNSAQFKTENEALAWLSVEEKNKSFGKPAYVEIIPPVLDENGVVESAKEVNHPSEYLIEMVDITAEVQAKKDKANKKDKDRKNRVKDLRAIDFKNINNVADLKPILKAIIDEILKDDE